MSSVALAMDEKSNARPHPIQTVGGTMPILSELHAQDLRASFREEHGVLIH
jgi:hypothetical protein